MHCARATFSFICRVSIVFAFLMIAVALAMPAHAQTTTVLQRGLNGYTGSIDAKIASSTPTTNKGAELDSAVIVDTSTALLLRFPIFQSEGGPIPNNANIISATLSLYKGWGPDGVFKANRVLKSWTELGVTWNSTGSQSWTTPGVFSGDMLPTADGQASVAAQPPVQGTQCDVDSGWPDICWLNIDVTTGVLAFQSGTANFGWKLSYVSGSNDSSPKDFWMSDVTCCNRVVRRPKLTVVYRSPPTAALSASPNPVAQGATITFDARNTTDGGSPITNLRLQFGDATPDVNWTDKNTTQPHVYNTPGTYTATLTATNAIGTSGPATQSVTVTTGPGNCNAAPTASFTVTPQPATVNSNVTFDASASNDGGTNCTINSLTLQFGDGAQTPPGGWTNKATPQQHPYATAGTYTATLAVANQFGSNQTTRQVVVNPVGQDILPDTSAQITDPAIGKVVETFHSMSIYFNPESMNPPHTPTGQTIWMRYRKTTDPNTAWHQGWPLWYDTRDSSSGPELPYAYKGRGSAVYLLPDQRYYFEVGVGASYAGAQWLGWMEGRTWADPLPEYASQTTISSPDGSNYVISVGGNVNGDGRYQVYNGQGATIKGDTSSGSGAIIVNAPYVIIRNVKVQQAYFSGIYIAPNVTHVVIEDSEISDYSWVSNGTPANWPYQTGGNEIGGIHLAGNNSNIVIQRNKIFDPHFGSSPWDLQCNQFGDCSSHPGGPTGIMTVDPGQQNVIRYNEIYASLNESNKAHWFQDTMMGNNNDSSRGFPGSDSDIYNNIVRNAFDDGIEAEGGGRNVRVWGNYIHHIGPGGVATSTVHYGPLYVFRNVIHRMRFRHLSDPDNDNINNSNNRGRAFKSFGSSGGYGGGREYFFNNTLLQQPGDTYNPPQTMPLGPGQGLSGASGGQGLVQAWSRNNILHVYRSDSASVQIAGGSNNDIDYDLYNGTKDGGEANGVFGVPTYKPGQGCQTSPSGCPGAPSITFDGGTNVGIGWFQLNSGTHSGTHLPNFTTGIENVELAHKSGVEIISDTVNPDVGAHQNEATRSMVFGLKAAQPQP